MTEQRLANCLEYDELCQEKEWRKTLLSPLERRQCFPEELIIDCQKNIKKDTQAKLYDLAIELEEEKKKGRVFAEFVRYKMAPLQKKLRSFQKIARKSDNIEQLRAVPILDVLDRYGIPYEKTYSNRVKFRLRKEDDTPSAVVYIDQNTYWDFGSGEGHGSVIDLVMHIEKCDVRKAIELLKKWL